MRSSVKQKHSPQGLDLMIAAKEQQIVKATMELIDKVVLINGLAMEYDTEIKTDYTDDIEKLSDLCVAYKKLTYRPRKTSGKRIRIRKA